MVKLNEDNFYILASSKTNLPVKNITKGGIRYGSDFEKFTDIQRFSSLTEAKIYLNFAKAIGLEELEGLHIFLFTKK